MRKLQWKPTEENDTLPALETVIVLIVLALIALIVYALM